MNTYFSILSTVNESQEQTLIDGISALMIFCKSPELKAQGQLVMLRFVYRGIVYMECFEQINKCSCL